MFKHKQESQRGQAAHEFLVTLYIQLLMIKQTCNFLFCICYHCTIVLKNGMCWKILAILCNSKFYNNSFSNSWFVRWRMQENRKANTCISANIMHILNWKQTLQALLMYMRPRKKGQLRHSGDYAVLTHLIQLPPVTLTQRATRQTSTDSSALSLCQQCFAGPLKYHYTKNYLLNSHFVSLFN